MIVIPSKAVPAVLEDCGKKGVKGAVMITAGFREAGAEGREREAQVLEVAAQYGMRVVGPNCLGLIDTVDPDECLLCAPP